MRQTKPYHFYFFILKFIIILLIILFSLKLIKISDANKNIIIEIIDSVFKLSIGLFIILFFSNSNSNILNDCDRILLILSGFILILLINFISVYKNIVHLCT